MKNRKYAIRILKIAKNNPFCQRIPNKYLIKFENISFDTSLGNNKYAKWNEDVKQTNKRITSKLIRVLHSVSDIVPKTDEFKKSNHFIKPWIFIYLIYLIIKCIQPKVMTLKYFRICFYNTNKSTLYNPSMYRQFSPVFTRC